jgi:glycosyltransferase involved in cell wall biosynthesis
MFKESVKGLNLCRNFIFLGERHDVEFLLRALDCLVFPAEQPETFGKVIIEAMACGIPVIASNIGATSEIITDGKDGILVQPKDPVELAEALKSVLVNLKTTDQLSRAARETVERRFDMQMNVQKIWKTYNSIITV